MRTAIRILVSALAVLACPAVAKDAAWSAGGGAWVLSDYVWRGVSQTQGDPAVQFEAFVEHDSGFFAGIWGTSVDFTGDESDEDGIDYELDPYLGWSAELGDDVELQLQLTRVLYPGYAPGYDYNYNEFEAKLGFARHYEASIAYSDDIFNLGGSGIYYHAQGEWALTESGFGVRAAFGHYDLDDAAGDSYSDTLLALTRTFGPVEAELQVTDTAGFGEALEEAVAEARLADRRVALVVAWEF
jgi:uncharacterized protein (TIGR02001 family)